MAFKFTEENLQRIENSKKKYPTNLAAVMDACYIGQEQNGYISNEVMAEIAEVLDIDKVNVLGVVTFYTMYFQKPMGKYHIQICTNVSCMLRGGYEIWETVKDKLGIENMGVTEDSKFSLEEVECMGACGYAPMIAVNEDFYENLTKEKVLEIIDSLK
ncbi:MAG: NADH-quinone oxidoreductase subunit NuoE [Melioribacteraceae bacterium]|nr:NADH-quinone oxidoreductase subunit NuoE [Melioribacteraceae bacterium]MCF8355329.1 NADH-quinone oxidoreductase subunit NuoE [Melioribacteraceae bacterium]MCF8396338.1 NADH-quinone oxidoreductase subunit NuoE [Melioribacteraceae bacterium]MCF8420407.1 NADH-quinone oxidoreductase subunit NuoE [Melioribacteraceae bacterium]